MVSTLDIPCTEGIHVYTCVAYAGEAVLSSEKSVVLPEDTCTDMSGNEETIQKWYSNIMVEIGAPIVLPCDHVSGRHRSHVSWTRDGYNILELSERVHVASDGGLVIEALGLFTCTPGSSRKNDYWIIHIDALAFFKEVTEEMPSASLFSH